MSHNANPGDKSYLNLSDLPEVTEPGINVWWSAKEPERIHLVFNTGEFNDETEKGPGLRLVFSSNPASADYNPAVFNRVARLLHANGRPAPAHPVEVKSRALTHRNKVIAELGAAQVPSLKQAGGKAAPAPGAPDNLGYLARAVPCPACAALVVDLELHDATCLARRGVAEALIDQMGQRAL